MKNILFTLLASGAIAMGQATFTNQAQVADAVIAKARSNYDMMLGIGAAIATEICFKHTHWAEGKTVGDVMAASKRVMDDISDGHMTWDAALDKECQEASDGGSASSGTNHLSPSPPVSPHTNAPPIPPLPPEHVWLKPLRLSNGIAILNHPDPMVNYWTTITNVPVITNIAVISVQPYTNWFGTLLVGPYRNFSAAPVGSVWMPEIEIGLTWDGRMVWREHKL
jgi:hypothetical protein